MPDLVIPELSDVLRLLPPAGAALAVFLLGAAVAKRFPRLFALAAIAAVLVAYAWTYLRARGSVAFPPRDSSERGFHAVLAGALLALVPGFGRLEFFRRSGLQIVGALVAVLFVPAGLFSTAIDPMPLLAVGIGAIAYFVLLDFGSFSPTPVFCACSAAALLATSQVFLLFSAALMAELAGGVGIALLLIGIASLFVRQHFPAPATIPLASIVTVLWLDNALYSVHRPPVPAVVMLAAAPAVPVVVYAAAASRLGARKAMILGVVVSFAIIALGFFLAWRAAPEPY